MKDVRLIALDLDDTLLNSRAQISDRNVAALRGCAARGIYVVLCSGRLEEAILPFVRRLEIAGTEAGRFIIAVNGCSVFDLHERRQVLRNDVPGEILVRADEIAREFGLNSEVYTPDTIFYGEETEETLLDVSLCGVKGVRVDDYRAFISRGFPKMLIPTKPGDAAVLVEVQARLRAEFGRRAVVFTSKPYFLEVLPPDCGKGEAVGWLCSHVGIPLGSAMAFGDGMNDESMIRLCGTGVAMKNGRDEIKEVADAVTELDNDHDGVADFIERNVLV